VTAPVRVENGVFAGRVKPASQEAAVYRIYDATNHLLYVGLTNDLTTRWYDHATRKGWWKTEAHHFEARWYASRAIARAEEVKAIRTERPKYNVSEASLPLRDVVPRTPGAYSKTEIAYRFRISRDKIRAFIQQGIFPTHLPSARRMKLLYPIDDVEQFFADRPGYREEWRP
jgi:predicted GIY-YIG superfamily endonuclease